MATRNLTDIFSLMRNNAIQRLHIFSDHMGQDGEVYIKSMNRLLYTVVSLRFTLHDYDLAQYSKVHDFTIKFFSIFFIERGQSIVSSRLKKRKQKRSGL